MKYMFENLIKQLSCPGLSPTEVIWSIIKGCFTRKKSSRSNDEIQLCEGKFSTMNNEDGLPLCVYVYHFQTPNIFCGHPNECLCTHKDIHLQNRYLRCFEVLYFCNRGT
jgi:hypothetical protein